jgi:hypothetical protein
MPTSARPAPLKVLITGASSGFGAAIARRLAAEGCHLALGARRAERLEALAGELREAHGIQVFTGAVDVRDSGAVTAFVDAAAAALGGLNVVVANAGLARGVAKVWDVTDADLQAMLRTNVEGLLYTLRAAIPHVRQAGWGHLFGIGSTAGHQVYEGGAAYCASKHGEKAVMQALRLELCGEPIRVTSVDPGMAETEFSLVRLEDAAKAEAVYQGLEPLRAEDIAECIRWVLSLPDHVNIDELIVKPRAQASVTKIHRQSL